VADIPGEMQDVRIPKLRLSRASSGLAAGNQGGADDPLAELVSLYDQLGEQRPELGRLIVKGDLAKPSVVMFVPDKALAEMQPKIKVKAFSIYGLNKDDRAQLLPDIQNAAEEAGYYARQLRSDFGSNSLRGMTSIHSDTSLLVAAGPDCYVDMVESIVAACHAKERARNPAAPHLPNAPKP
jgi:hypothetical protein